jgi:hypothetical protein
VSRSTGPAASHPDFGLASISVALGVLVHHLFSGAASVPISDSVFSLCDLVVLVPPFGPGFRVEPRLALVCKLRRRSDLHAIRLPATISFLASLGAPMIGYRVVRLFS